MDQAVELRRRTMGIAPRMTSPEVRGREDQADPPVRVIAVTSGKGGVGKTNVVINLAVACARAGRKVLVIDADLGLSNVDILLGLTPRYTLQHVLNGTKRLDEALITGPEGILILPAASGVEELTSLNEQQRLGLIDRLESADIDVDLVFVDTGAGIGNNVMFFNTIASEILVIANPEPASVADAYALMKVLATRYGEKRFRLLVNGVSDHAEAKRVYQGVQSVADRFLSVSIEFFGFVPNDACVGQSVLKRRPVVAAYPESSAAKQITRLARKLMDAEPRTLPKGGLQLFWRRMLGQTV